MVGNPNIHCTDITNSCLVATVAAVAMALHDPSKQKQVGNLYLAQPRLGRSDGLELQEMNRMNHEEEGWGTNEASIDLRPYFSNVVFPVCFSKR